MVSNTSFFDENVITKNERVISPELTERNIQLFVKREDQIHPEISGNKYRKLKYNLLEAQCQNLRTLLTFGGAFSNHILATASAGNALGFETIGVIRGEELGLDIEKTLLSNSTLRRASQLGMQFEFVTREQYREKTDNSFLSELKKKYGSFYLIPEGGTNEFAVRGCEDILKKEDEEFDYICSCVGTGGTLAGIIRSSLLTQKVIGFPALKGNFLISEVKQFVGEKTNWALNNEYHFGGYGKYSEELIHFINEFKEKTKIPLDPIYTGKMMFGIFDMIRKEKFRPNTKILVIHTGGLQGIEGFNQRLARSNKDFKIFT